MSDNNFALIAWIKREQEEKAAHQAKMVVKNYKEDKEFLNLVKAIVKSWKLIKVQERIFVTNMVKHHEEGLNLTVRQRSELTRIWLKVS